MSSVGRDNAGLGTRANQEETSPFPLELMLAAALACQRDDIEPGTTGRDETAPFLLDFEILSSRKLRSSQQRRTQDETAPFPLEFMVVRPDGEVALVRTSASSLGASSPGAIISGSSGPLPRLKWRGIDASAELREYAARIASGEDLPPFSGPILANEVFPASVPAAPRAREHAGARRAGENDADSRAFLKLALSLIVMSAALVAATLLGDDAQLRAAGQAISGWFQGPERRMESFPLVEPGSSGNAAGNGASNAPCAAPSP